MWTFAKFRHVALFPSVLDKLLSNLAILLISWRNLRQCRWIALNWSIAMVEKIKLCVLSYVICDVIYKRLETRLISAWKVPVGPNNISTNVNRLFVLKPNSFAVKLIFIFVFVKDSKVQAKCYWDWQVENPKCLWCTENNCRVRKKKASIFFLLLYVMFVIFSVESNLWPPTPESHDSSCFYGWSLRWCNHIW